MGTDLGGARRSRCPKWTIRASPITQGAGLAIVLLVAATVGYIILSYRSLPFVLPVHFRAGGIPDGWQFKTPGRVLLPAFIQASLALTLGTIATLLLSRTTAEHDPDAADVRAASAAAETVVLMALIWVAFQAYAAFALLRVWTTEHGNIGWLYSWLEGAGLLLTLVVIVRGHARLGRPGPRPYVPRHWRLGQLYKNADDPALFVPTRDGTRWTLNFGRPVAAALLGIILSVGLLGPIAILALGLRYNF